MTKTTYQRRERKPCVPLTGKMAMMEEMSAVEKNETWEIVDLPPGKKTESYM